PASMRSTKLRDIPNGTRGTCMERARRYVAAVAMMVAAIPQTNARAIFRRTACIEDERPVLLETHANRALQISEPPTEALHSDKNAKRPAQRGRKERRHFCMPWRDRAASRPCGQRGARRGSPCCATRSPVGGPRAPCCGPYCAQTVCGW